MQHFLRDEDDLVRTLADLVGLDEREVTLYANAIAQFPLDASGVRAGLVAIRAEHWRHAARLRSLMVTLGGDVDSRDAVTILMRGRLALAALAGGGALLKLMKREEARVTRAYLAAMTSRLPPDIRDGMALALREQLVHQAWLEEAIAERERGPGAGASGTRAPDPIAHRALHTNG
jgi:hypothetical protein